MRHARSLKGQFLRSIVASLAGFSLDALILAALVEIVHIHHLVANIPSFIAGTSVVWIISRSWVFPESRFKDQRLGYAFFLFLAATGLFLNELLFWLAVDILGIWYLMGKVLCASLVFLYNFACRKFLIFSKPREPVS